MVDSLKIASLESQVSTLTALVAELQKRVTMLEERVSMASGWIGSRDFTFAYRFNQSAAAAPGIAGPDFPPPLQPESAPRGPQA